MDNTQHNKIYISALHIVSAFAVVGLHTNGCFWEFSRERWWFTANIIESVFYFAVPVFFMITGATLLDYTKRYDTKTFFIRRIKKIVIPFLFWSIVALLFRIYFFKDISWNEVNVIYIIDGIINTRFNNLYWFFIPLFSLYLSIPLFANIWEDKKILVLKYLVIICFLLNSFIPFMLTVLKIKIHFPLVVTVGSGYLLYLILGYLFDNIELSRQIKALLYSLAVLGLLVHAVGTYMLSMEAGEIIITFKGYNNVPCALYSIGAYLFVKDCSHVFNRKSISGGVEKLKEYAFSIYLLHWFVMYFLINFLQIDIYSMIYRLGGMFVVSYICVYLAKVIRKIPLLGKRILP